MIFSWVLRLRISFEGMSASQFSSSSVNRIAWSASNLETDISSSLPTSLICNTENRLGRGGAHEIKSHSFFRGVEFDSLRRIHAPFEPRLTSNIDTTYFPTDEIDQTDNATLIKAQQAAQGRSAASTEESPEMSLPFIGYTFKRFDNNFR